MPEIVILFLPIELCRQIVVNNCANICIEICLNIYRKCKLKEICCVCLCLESVRCSFEKFVQKKSKGHARTCMFVDVDVWKINTAKFWWFASVKCVCVCTTSCVRILDVTLWMKYANKYVQMRLSMCRVHCLSFSSLCLSLALAADWLVIKLIQIFAKCLHICLIHSHTHTQADMNTQN